MTFPWFLFYTILFDDPVTGALASALHDDDDERHTAPPPFSGPVAVPNVIETPGNRGDYDV